MTKHAPTGTEHGLIHREFSDGTLTPACICGWYSARREHADFEQHIAAGTDQAAAKLRAGYSELDTPCHPSRAAYTDDIDGEAAYVLALHRWHAYITLADLWGIPLP
jgi:hypothetical protein